MPGPIEVDEDCLYRMRKGRRGRLAKTKYWVFGLKCRTTKQVVVYPVLYRTKDHLIKIIRSHVPAGATIYSDRFSAYFNNRTNPPTSHLRPYGYTHFGINHSQHFVSEIDSSIHTNTIERVEKSQRKV